MALVSACLAIHSFSSRMLYFYMYPFILCVFFLLLENKFDLISFDLICYNTLQQPGAIVRSSDYALNKQRSDHLQDFK